MTNGVAGHRPWSGGLQLQRSGAEHLPECRPGIAEHGKAKELHPLRF